MLKDSPVYANIPVVDIDRAKRFYSEMLGLGIESEAMQGVTLMKGGNNTKILLYQRPPIKTDHTHASFVVDDIYESVKQLAAKGVTFEEYDMGNGFTTDEHFVMAVGPTKAAWFKDSEGNVLALNQKM
jgi:predicted enzyme related to lactoylglutathione lyase